MSDEETTMTGGDALRGASTQRRFETPGRVSLRVENAAGQVEISTHESATTEVSLVALERGAESLVKSARIEEHVSVNGHEVIVEVPHTRGMAKLWAGSLSRVEVIVKVPIDAKLDVSTASASILARGRYETASVRSASGAIAIEQVTGAARIQSASGRLEVGSVGELADVKSASGDVTIGDAASGGTVSTASGDIELGRAGKVTRIRAASGNVHLREALQGADIETVSGDQRIERAGAGDYRMRAVSGDITVAVVPGTLVRFDAGTMSGRVETEIAVESSRPVEAGEKGAVRELSIQAKTVSGDISVARATS
jgi:DUF4097 and DUF4098 domain-containing protein YvlB